MRFLRFALGLGALAACVQSSATGVFDLRNPEAQRFAEKEATRLFDNLNEEHRLGGPTQRLILELFETDVKVAFVRAAQQCRDGAEWARVLQALHNAAKTPEEAFEADATTLSNCVQALLRIASDLEAAHGAPAVGQVVAHARMEERTEEQRRVYNVVWNALAKHFATSSLDIRTISDVISRSDVQLQNSFFTVLSFNHDEENQWSFVNIRCRMLAVDSSVQAWDEARRAIRAFLDGIPRPRMRPEERPFDVRSKSERDAARDARYGAIAHLNAIEGVTDADRNILGWLDTGYKVAFMHAAKLCQDAEQRALVLNTLRTSGAEAYAAFQALREGTDPSKTPDWALGKEEEGIDALARICLYLIAVAPVPVGQMVEGAVAGPLAAAGGVAIDIPAEVRVAPVLPPVELGLGNFDSRAFSHVIAIPDVHGDAEFFIRSLWKGFIEVEADAELRAIPFERFDAAVRAVAVRVDFSRENPTELVGAVQPLSRLGRQVALVQLGDIMDRGTESLLCFKILASIEAAIGWKLIRLIGNHETMMHDHVVSGRAGFPGYMDLRDVTNYGGEAQLRNMFSPIGAGTGSLWRFITSNGLAVVRIGTPIPDESVPYEPNNAKADTLFMHADIEGVWLRDFLSGFTAGTTEIAYADEGYFGGEVAFTGRLTPDVCPAGGWRTLVASLNGWAREQLSTEGQQKNQVSSIGGPLETRRHVYQESAATCEEVEELLRVFRVSRIIVGHTPQENFRVAPKCGGKFIAADVRMSRGFRHGDAHERGQPVAVVLTFDHGRLVSEVAHYTHPVAAGHHDSVRLD